MSDTATRNLTDKATYERLEKDVTAVKNDIAALTDQITDALNSFAGTATKQARRGYKQARAGAEQAMDDVSERGSAMMDAAQDAASSIEESLEEVITQRPLATVGLALGLGIPDRPDVAQVIQAQTMSGSDRFGAGFDGARQNA